MTRSSFAEYKLPVKTFQWILLIDGKESKCLYLLKNVLNLHDIKLNILSHELD